MAKTDYEEREPDREDEYYDRICETEYAKMFNQPGSYVQNS
jgi:hypothetical protein